MEEFQAIQQKNGIVTMEHLDIIITARENKRTELLNACRMIFNQTRKYTGCAGCRMLEDEKETNRIIVNQQWEQRQLLNNYFRSDHFSALLGAMKWLGEQYAIQINGGTPDEGLNSIEQARK
jgi:quinol monooxygenase YgiN